MSKNKTQPTNSSNPNGTHKLSCFTSEDIYHQFIKGDEAKSVDYITVSDDLIRKTIALADIIMGVYESEGGINLESNTVIQIIEQIKTNLRMLAATAELCYQLNGEPQRRGATATTVLD